MARRIPRTFRAEKLPVLKTCKHTHKKNMKNASNNRELAHLWANQSYPSAVGSNFLFDGPTLYSYGEHFAVAKLVSIGGEVVALHNPAKRSITTTRHQSLARAAVSHLKSYHLAVALWETVHDAETLAAAVAEQARADLQAQVDLQAAKAAARARAKARAKAEKEALAAYPEELAAWRAGGRLPRFLSGNLSNNYAALRVTARRGKSEIETSRGAFVPIAVCRKLWPLLDAAVCAEYINPTAVSGRAFFDGPDFRWGDYTGVRLWRRAGGAPIELIVGCHTIPWPEIVQIAETLGLKKTEEVTA